MGLDTRRAQDHTTQLRRGMRHDEPATTRSNLPPDPRPPYLPTDRHKIRQGGSSEQESSSDEDGTIVRMDRDRQRYQHDPRDAISRRRPTDDSIPQLASRHHRPPLVYNPVHSEPNQSSTGNVNFIPATGGYLPFTQASLAFQSTLNPVALGFVAKELDGYDGCRVYINRYDELLDAGPRPFITEAANALKVRKELYAKNCLWKALLIQECEELSPGKRRAFFDELETKKPEYEKFKLAFDKSWDKLQTRVGNITPAASPRVEVRPTPQPRRTSQVYPSTLTFTPDSPHDAFQRGVPPNAQMPVYQTSGGNREQRVEPTKTISPAVAGTETASYSELFARVLTGKRIKAIEEAAHSSTQETISPPRKNSHPSYRRTPKLGTQWIDVYAPKAKSKWPIEGWPYIPTLAFLDSGSRGNVNSVSKEFLEEKLNMTYQSTDDKIRGHENSFTPLGTVKIEFNPVDTDERGESEVDLPVTLSFYVHNENDLFGQILLGLEYMRSRKYKIGLPTHKDMMKLNPEEQKIANEKMAKRDAASQRVWDANNNSNPPSGNNGNHLAREQGTNRHGQSTSRRHQPITNPS